MNQTIAQLETAVWRLEQISQREQRLLRWLLALLSLQTVIILL
jgi:DNA-binding CsgD family transcriptional regulator